MKHHELLLENLSLSQVEEALSCLHLELEPQSPELQKLEQSACPTCGSCSGMFTANSMNCLVEALGIGLATLLEMTDTTIRSARRMREVVGLPVLARFEGMRAYPTVLYNVNREWAAKGEAGMRVARAIQRAHTWLYDPANKAEAVALLMQETKQSKEISEKTYDYVVADLQAFSRKLDVPDADFNNVLKLFQELGVVKSREATKAKYVDLSFLNK